MTRRFSARDRIKIVGIVAIIFLSVGRSALAQSAAPLGVSAGQRVRVQAPTVFTESRKGDVLAPVGDTLFLKERHVVHSIPVNAITHLEVSRGKNPWARGLLGFLGATAGFVGSLFLGANLLTAIESSGDASPFGYGIAGVGMIAGAFVGARAAPERWEKIRIR